MNSKHVEGHDSGKILVYALSTCGWCKKTKKLLSQLGVAYDYVDVDQLQGDEKERIREEIRRHNPSCSFPTTLINDRCIIGFKEEEIKSALSQ